MIKKKTFYVILIDFLCVMFSVLWNNIEDRIRIRCFTQEWKQKDKRQTHTHTQTKQPSALFFISSQIFFPSSSRSLFFAIYLKFPFL